MQKQYKIGICFGVWDLFHIGHLNLIKNAKELCEELYVCVSTDEYVEKIKGKTPIYSYNDRKKIVKAIKYVDLVAPQSLQFGKAEAIELYKPDVIFVGSDWNKDTFSGEGLGVPVIYLPHTDGISSTIIAEKMSKEGDL